MYVYICDVYVIDVPTYVYPKNVYYYVHTCTSQTDRKTDRKTDRRKDGRMERWTHGKKERRTERETGRQTCVRACLTYSDNGFGYDKRLQVPYLSFKVDGLLDAAAEQV